MAPDRLVVVATQEALRAEVAVTVTEQADGVEAISISIDGGEATGMITATMKRPPGHSDLDVGRAVICGDGTSGERRRPAALLTNCRRCAGTPA